jgi:hypothetical protein
MDRAVELRKATEVLSIFPESPRNGFDFSVNCQINQNLRTMLS